MTAPSIFNDVLGPVMRGPSSSHSAGALRIGRIALDLMQGQLSSALVEYDPNGSLVTTHKSQGSDMGLFGGFLGWNADDSRLPEYNLHLKQADIQVDIDYVSYGAKHPNTYKLTLVNNEIKHQLTAISTGGGMIKVMAIDQAPVTLNGDSFVLILYLDNTDGDSGKNFATLLTRQYSFDSPQLCRGDRCFIILESAQGFEPRLIEQLVSHSQITEYRLINPVMPILNNPDMQLPFDNCEQLIGYIEQGNQSKPLWQLALEYEEARSGLPPARLMVKMAEICQVMKAAVATGLGGTEFKDRLLPAQSPAFKQKNSDGQLLQTGMLNEIIMQVSAIMEAKSSMHTIVAAPTAGSCGAMAGAVLGAATTLCASDQNICKALFVAGLIGVFVANDATFAAEEAGCMAECGTGSAMAAAALVSLQQGSVEQCLAAASMALQNSFGMVCDPIANRVEAPCLGKNVMAASNALACANMALAGYQQVIPLHEVIIAMAKVGAAIPPELCCTALGGLSITPTAQRLEQQLEGKVAAADLIRFKSC